MRGKPPPASRPVDAIDPIDPIDEVGLPSRAFRGLGETRFCRWSRRSRWSRCPAALRGRPRRGGLLAGLSGFRSFGCSPRVVPLRSQPPCDAGGPLKIRFVACKTLRSLSSQDPLTTLNPHHSFCVFGAPEEIAIPIIETFLRC